MICEGCGEREASVHLTRIINGEKTEMHLCEKCAQKSSKLNNDNNLSFQSLLSGILNQNLINQNSPVFNDNQSQNLVCNNCGMSYQEFIQRGFFGCEDCYEAFKGELDQLFKRIHGNPQHTGKYPLSFRKKIKIESEINKLKEEMKLAVDKENFEKAAEIRDEIHAIEENMEENCNAE
ncbi:MAG: UvrB/UvrC motif-containing protein [Bacillota bacterium]